MDGNQREHQTTDLLVCPPQPKTCRWQLTWRGNWKFHHISASLNRDRSSWSLRLQSNRSQLEMTVPWVDRMEEPQERKKEKYQELVEDCQRNSWRTGCMPVEESSWGFACHSLSKACATVGITCVNRKWGINNNMEATKKVSSCLKKGEKWGQ